MIGREDVGFQILLGPPLNETPILFLGYQPGKGKKTPLQERNYGSEDRWPEISEYVTENWRLATNLRAMFGMSLLKQCVGLNAIFVRSDNIDVYRKNFDLHTRRQIEKFCLPRVKEIIEAVRPKRIVAIGIATLDLFGGRADPCLTGEKNVLAKLGKIADRDVIGVKHLSGAYISTPDRKKIADYILTLANSI